jgi:hypothetical protein
MIKNEKNPAFGQKKVRADIFSGSLAVFRNVRSAVPEGGSWRAKISAAALKISSYFFQGTPPIRKWGALRQHSPANFGFKSEFFTFVPRSGTPKAGFSNFLIKV